LSKNTGIIRKESAINFIGCRKYRLWKQGNANNKAWTYVLEKNAEYNCVLS
jgi:hypothetical protein